MLRWERSPPTPGIHPSHPGMGVALLWTLNPSMPGPTGYSSGLPEEKHVVFGSARAPCFSVSPPGTLLPKSVILNNDGHFDLV